MRPRVARLGRYEDGTLRDLSVHPHLPNDPQIICLRFDGELYFANVSYFEDILLVAANDKPDAKFVLVVGDGINQLDASGEEVVHHLVRRMEANGITMVFSGLKRQVLQVMHRTNLFDHIGNENIFATEGQALASIYERLEIEEGKRPLMDPPAAPASATAAAE